MTAVGAAVAASVVLAALGVLQVLVASGRPYGRLVWGGQHRVLPRRLRIGSAVSVVAYAGMAAVLLARATAADPVPAWLSVTTWVLVGYFGLGVLLNAVSRSRPERLVMTPATVLLAAAALLVALS